MVYYIAHRSTLRFVCGTTRLKTCYEPTGAAFQSTTFTRTTTSLILIPKRRTLCSGIPPLPSLSTSQPLSTRRGPTVSSACRHRSRCRSSSSAIRWTRRPLWPGILWQGIGNVYTTLLVVLDAKITTAFCAYRDFILLTNLWIQACFHGWVSNFSHFINYIYDSIA